MKSRKDKMGRIFILALVMILLVGFFYIAKLFGGEGSITSEKPIIFCIPEDAPPHQQECFYTAHEHMQLKISINGEEQNIGFEKGDLQKSHTHAEKNKIHWHSVLNVDPLTKEVVGWYPHSIKASLEELGLENLSSVVVIVNGNLEPNGLDYIWKDGDTIEVRVG